MAVDNHLYNPGCAAMKLNLSRYETLEHREFRYRRRVGDSCVPGPSAPALETQRSTI